MSSIRYNYVNCLIFQVRQNRLESLTEYRKMFVAVAQVLEHIKVYLGRALAGTTDGLMADRNGNKVDRTKTTSEQLKVAGQEALDKMLATLFITSADKARYANIATYMETEYVAGG